MFEGDFSYKDLEQIELEINELSNINFKKQKTCVWRIHRSFANLENLKISNIEKFILSNFVKYCHKNENVSKIITYIINLRTEDNYKFLSEISKNYLKEIDENLVYLKTNQIYSINKNFIKTRINNHIKILKNLKNQKDLIRKHINSINLNQKRLLNAKFLENESLIYSKYYIKDANTLEHFARHMQNSIYYDLFSMSKHILRNITLLITFLVMIGWLICSSYFIFKVNTVPTIQREQLLLAGILGVLILLFIIFSMLLSSYYIFKTYHIKYNYILSKLFSFSQICLFLILIIPFAELSKPLADFANSYLYPYIHIAIIIYLCILLLYFVIYIFSSKNLTDSVFV